MKFDQYISKKKYNVICVIKKKNIKMIKTYKLNILLIIIIYLLNQYLS